MKPFHLYSELLPFQSEPAQLATGSPGKVAYLRMGFERRGEKTILADLDRKAPLIVHRAIYWDEQMPHMPCIFIISNAGGIVQGDRNTLSFELAAGTHAHITTQSATKIHEMDANFATQLQDIVLHENSYLEYLPDPSIPHRNSRFFTRTQITIDPTATLLYSEILMAGRKHHGDGERFQYELYSSTVRARRPGAPDLFTEKFLIQPLQRSVRQIGVMGPFDVFGNVILLTPKAHADRIAAQVPAVWNPEEGWAAGVSRLPNGAGLIYKVLGMETAQVREQVRFFWSIVRPEVVGAQIPREFSWR